MEAQPSAIVYPRWVMLEQHLEINVDDSSCPLADYDAKTLVAARTSTGHQIQVSLRLEEPPAPSHVCLRIPDGLQLEKSMVLAAHGDSVLIQVHIKLEYQPWYTADHFVYNAGAAAADPPRTPSLSLLPPLPDHIEGAYFVPRELSDEATGLLCRGEDELVVAQLGNWWSSDDDPPWVGELYMFRSNQWKYHQFEIKEAWDLSSVRWNTVVPVDDHLLCWVSLYNGVMLIDVFEETPTVQYVPLPMDAHDTTNFGISTRNVCATAGGSTLKFINIFQRCCCGAAASCGCERSRHAYTIHTWTMRIGNGDGDMEWVKDGMVDATELWALDAYKGLPCAPVCCPIVSTDEPEVICFRLRDTIYSWTLWQIMVNMKSKTIHSVSRHEQEVGYCYNGHGYTNPWAQKKYLVDKLFPSNVSYFFNTLRGQIQMDDDEKLAVRDVDDSSNQMLQASSFAELASVQALQEMFEALQEIPSYGLGPDEIKAYRILNGDNGHRLTSLLRLPKDIRKDWLLMEIKVSDAY